MKSRHGAIIGALAAALTLAATAALATTVYILVPRPTVRHRTTRGPETTTPQRRIPDERWTTGVTPCRLAASTVPMGSW
jgi:hypothetical protein